MTFGPGVGTIKISTWMENASSSSASVYLYKYVPYPADVPSVLFRYSPVFAGVELAQCTYTRSECDVACNGIGGCSTAPWSSGDTCDIWICQSATIDCAPGGYDFWAAACTNTLFKAALAAPFSLACVLPDDGEQLCSVGTSAFGHGAIAMECDIGQCAASLDPDAMATTGYQCDSNCQSGQIAALIIVPIFITIVLLFGCVALDRGSLRGEQTPQIDGLGGGGAMVVDAKDDLHIVANAGSTSAEGPAAAALNPPSYILVNNLVLSIPLPPPGCCGPREDADQGGEDAVGEFRGRFARKRVVLRGVSLFMGGRDMLAICGPSGSGKTSLLDIVAGRKTVGKVEGNMLVNGQPVLHAKQLQAVCGYVMQDDNLPGTSTVREVLMFHATLRMAAAATRAERIAKVNEVIAELGLGKAQSTVIGDGTRRGVSGGERRRCSVGIEMVAGKSILLMDEPVSGLDSQSAEQVVQSLARLSASGKGVAISIHQPSSRIFHLFSMVAVLTRFGQLAYFGPSSRLADFLASVGKPVPSNYNPCEFVIDIVSIRPQADVDALIVGFLSSPIWQDQSNKANELQKIVLPPQLNWGSSASFTRQVITLSSRFAINSKRHRILPFVHVVAMISVSLVASVLYWQASLNLGGAINRAGYFFLMQTYLTLSALADLGVWQEERMCFIRERASGAYGATAYLIAKLLCEVIALRLVPIVVACFIMVNCIGLVNTGVTLSNMIGVFLFLSIDSVLLFLWIGFFFSRAGVANFVAVVISMLNLALSGFLLIDFGLVTNPNLGGSSSISTSVSGLTSAPTTAAEAPAQISPVRYVPYILGFLDYLRPGFEILVTNELSSLTFNVALQDSNGDVTSGSIPLTGNTILAQLGLNAARMTQDFALLAMWVFIFFMGALITLEVYVMEKR